ncbi:hypothetical protein Tco_0433031 [Tanacetum coccineum]
MALFQYGLDNASFGLRGMGHGDVVTKRLNGFFGLEIPDILRVCMVARIFGCSGEDNREDRDVGRLGEDWTLIGLGGRDTLLFG